eukprot:7061309-Prymnesium_polylepis.1
MRAYSEATAGTGSAQRSVAWCTSGPAMEPPSARGSSVMRWQRRRALAAGPRSGREAARRSTARGARR